MVNPKFYELQRLRKSTWDTPRFVRGYDVTLDGDLVLPRALRHLVATIVNGAGSRLEVTDTRDCGHEIDATFRATLHEPQIRAVNAMLAHDDGSRRTTRGGQDSDGVRDPRRTRRVHTGAGGPQSPGRPVAHPDHRAARHQARAGRRRPDQAHRPGGHRDAATLARRGDIEELTSGYGQVIVDECHHLAAGAYDHSVKRIRAQLWLGLTATPRRRDGLEDLVQWQLGPIRHTVADADTGTLDEMAADLSGSRREFGCTRHHSATTAQPIPPHPEAWPRSTRP